MHWGFTKILCKACLHFNYFLVIKGISKAMFSFIPWLLNFSDLPNYGSKSKENIYNKGIVKVSCEEHPSPPPTLRYPLWYPFWYPLRFSLDGLFLAQFDTYVLAKLLQNGTKFIQNWLQISKIIWGIWITSDKQWKVQKV